MSIGFMEERIIWRERFQAEYFDFRGKSLFRRFDCCEFVKCTLLIDHSTEQLAFTECVFKDCNIDKLEPDLRRGLYVQDNIFDRPLQQRHADLESRLAQFVAARKTKGLMNESNAERSIALRGGSWPPISEITLGTNKRV